MLELEIFVAMFQFQLSLLLFYGEEICVSMWKKHEHPRLYSYQCIHIKGHTKILRKVLRQRKDTNRLGDVIGRVS